MTKQVNAFSQNAITQFGLSEKATKQYMGTFGAMSKSFGFSEEAAYEMSKTVTGLVGDVASFYNISQDLAAVKLKAIWTGETEGLKDLGIVMTQTALQEFALQKGMNKTMSQMSEAEKVALRYSFVQEKLALATGDFARTSDGWANQTRVLSLRFEQLKATLGQGFITLFTPIIKGINTILAGLQKVADVFTAVVNKIFGKQKETVSNVSSEYVSLGSSALGSADDITSASKKAQKAVMGYDKLNILSNKKDDKNSNSVSVPNISNIDLDTTKVEDKITNLDNIFNKINFEPLINSFAKLKDAILPLCGNIWDGLKWAYDNILKPLAKFTIKKALPTFLDLISGALKILNPILEAFKSVFTPVWNNLLKPVLSWTGGLIVDILQGLADVLSSIGNWMSEHQKVVEDFVIVIGSFALAWGAVNLALNAWNIGIALWNGLGVVATTVTTAFGAAIAFLTSPIGIVTLAIGAVIATVALLIKHWDSVKEAASKCWDKIKEAWNIVATWFDETIIQPVSNFFSGMWNGLKNGAHNAWEGIKSIFGNVASFFKNIFTDAWEGVKAVFSTGGKIFDGIKDGIVKAFTTIVNAIIRGINKVVSIPFDGINWALKKVKNISIAGFKPFDWIDTINVPQIPELAEGAWFKARNPRLAIVGEGKNNEIVAPEPKLDDAIDRGFKKHGGVGKSTIDINLNVKYEDGRAIRKKIKDVNIEDGRVEMDI